MKTKLYILLFAILAFSNVLQAGKIKIGSLFYSLNYTLPCTAEVTFGNDKYSGDIVIPSTITYEGTTFTVTSIGENAFSECAGLTSVSIPNTVSNIGEGAFWVCTNLTAITIPNSVTSLGRAFGYCSGLTEVTIPNSVTSNIESHTFYGWLLSL